MIPYDLPPAFMVVFLFLYGRGDRQFSDRVCASLPAARNGIWSLAFADQSALVVLRPLQNDSAGERQRPDLRLAVVARTLPLLQTRHSRQVSADRTGQRIAVRAGLFSGGATGPLPAADRQLPEHLGWLTEVHRSRRPNEHRGRELASRLSPRVDRGTDRRIADRLGFHDHPRFRDAASDGAGSDRSGAVRQFLAGAGVDSRPGPLEIARRLRHRRVAQGERPRRSRLDSARPALGMR